MKTIIVIGGSKGIGKALVKKLLTHSKVINISRSKPNLTHNNLTHYYCNVTQDELPEIKQADGLVYCPGNINLKPITSLSIKDFIHDFEINVLGAVKSIQKYLHVLKKGHNPAIVLFGSVATKLGMPFHTSIATVKAGIEGLVKSLAAEMAPAIRVNAIAPTVTNTQLAHKILRNEKMIENITNRHPLKKILEPEEVAILADFLISENTMSLTGQIFYMDCGLVTLKI